MDWFVKVIDLVIWASLTMFLVLVLDKTSGIEGNLWWASKTTWLAITIMMTTTLYAKWQAFLSRD